MTHSDRFYRSLARWSITSQLNPSNTSSTQAQAQAAKLPRSLQSLSHQSIDVLKRLIDHQPIHPDPFPKKRRAAVMVGLFASRHGHLNVLLTRRSKTMRTYAGQTALPGGKMEPQDWTLEDTARREAYEECGITTDRHRVRKLTSLAPFLTRGHLIVTPIVFFISDQTLIPRINTQEVDLLFSHPLESFVTGPISRSFDNPWFSTNVPYRLFEFPSRHSPILGFTADVLIQVAVIGYGREPSFDWKAPGQLGMDKIIRLALDQAVEFRTDDQANRVLKHDILDLDPSSPSSSSSLTNSFTSLREKILKTLGLTSKL